MRPNERTFVSKSRECPSLDKKSLKTRQRWEIAREETAQEGMRFRAQGEDINFERQKDTFLRLKRYIKMFLHEAAGK